MFISDSVPDWAKMLDILEGPDYEQNYLITFACLCSTVTAFLFNDDVSNFVIHKLVYAALPEEDADFVYK